MRSGVDDEQLAWTIGAIRRAGLTATGAPSPPVVNAWSTIWTLPTDGGLLWFKQSHPGDGAVEAALAELVPAWVNAPVAVEPARGRLLTRDGGDTVDAHLAGTGPFDPDLACRLVRDYATVQRETLTRRSRLREAGIPVAEPERAQDVALAQATYLSELPDGDPRRLPPADHAAVVRAAPELLVAGEALTAGPVPLGLDHGDLSTRNILMPRTGGSVRFFDFSDARWAHPFESLLMILWDCARRWRITVRTDAVDLSHPRLRQVTDAYLAGWDDVAAVEQLRPLLAHALRIAPLHRAGVWIRILADADGDARSRHGATPSSWLLDTTVPVLV